MSQRYQGEGPVVGASVVSADGHQLGTVAEIGAGRFKVSAPLQPDYWLATARITGAPGGVIQMDFAHEHLAGAKMVGPSGQDDPAQKGILLDRD